MRKKSDCANILPHLTTIIITCTVLADARMSLLWGVGGGGGGVQVVSLFPDRKVVCGESRRAAETRRGDALRRRAADAPRRRAAETRRGDAPRRRATRPRRSPRRVSDEHQLAHPVRRQLHQWRPDGGEQRAQRGRIALQLRRRPLKLDAVDGGDVAVQLDGSLVEERCELSVP